VIGGSLAGLLAARVLADSYRRAARAPHAWTVGRRTFAVKVLNAYMSKLHQAAHRDPAVALAFHKVGNLLAPPPAVLAPRIAWRVDFPKPRV